MRRLLAVPIGLALVAAASISSATASTPTVISPGSIWLTSGSVSSVRQYLPGADGDVAPTSTLVGSSTGLALPDGAALTAAHGLWIANANGTSGLTSYAAGATGDAAPVATIHGSNTGLNGTCGVALTSTGAVWTMTASETEAEEFAPGANGNVAPIRTITLASTTCAIGVSPDDRFWATDPGSDSVDEYPATGSGALSPTMIGGSNTGLDNPEGLAFAPSGALWVASLSNHSIEEFAPGATGNVLPIRTIEGPETGLGAVVSIGLTATDQIWVTSHSSASEFAANANGNVAPIATITPTPADTDLNNVVVFSDVPSAPSLGTVTPGHHKVTVKWTPPASTGGGLLGYIVSSGASKSGPWTPLAVTAATSATVTGSAKRYYDVQAYNQAGRSAASAASKPPHAPSAPRHVKLTASKHAIKVSWKSPSHHGGAPITGYVVKYASCRIGSHGCHVHKRSVGVTKHHKLSGLHPHHKYDVEVLARNLAGTGAASAPVHAKTKS
jgi:Fibronectin type III domain